MRNKRPLFGLLGLALVAALIGSAESPVESHEQDTIAQCGGFQAMPACQPSCAAFSAPSCQAFAAPSCGGVQSYAPAYAPPAYTFAPRAIAQSEPGHTHRCAFCGYAWSHGNSNYGNPAAHACPNCGRV